MKTSAFALFALLLSCASLAYGQSNAFSDVTLIRVFLNNTESTLVSYGEIAMVGDRAVFSMPIPRPSGNPSLQLISIPSDRVDWTKTNRYAESARASHYLSTRAATDYIRLTNEVAQALNEVPRVADPARRLQILEAQRQRLAEWPPAHFNFNAAEVQQTLAYLDETIADLRASSGVAQFSLNLTASAGPVTVIEPTQPPPSLKEAIEQVLLASTLAESSVDRSVLLVTALNELRGNLNLLPPEWAEATGIAVRSEIAETVQVEREYQLLSQKMIRTATDYARAADVRSIVKLQSDIELRDAAMGRRRPDMMASLNASVAEQLEAAQRLRLARDHWAARIPAIRRYNVALAPAMDRFAVLRPPLDDIRALAGSGAATLALVSRLTNEILKVMARVAPPEELASAHALFASAVQLADSAGRIRSEAVQTGNINRAWDASSAAAGALLLFTQASSQIQAALRQPQP